MARAKSYERRAQIVEAALALLADVPLEKLTTRLIAKQVGVSQPALFRHFRSRDAILEAVIVAMRERLSLAATQLLEETPSPVQRARGLVQILLQNAEVHPGLVRLVLAETADAGERPYQATLDHLVSMQRSLFASFVRSAQAEKELSARVDPEVASRLIIALVQGTLLSWLREGRDRPLRPWAAHLSELWIAGLRPGSALAGDTEAPTASTAPPEPNAPRLAVLDVRPNLKSGADPLEQILALLEGLNRDGLAVVVAPFRPKPLMALLAERGHRVEVTEVAARTFQLTIVGHEAPALIDLSELEAPLPLERVLAAAASLPVGGTSHFRVPRLPRLLLPRLAQRGIAYEAHEQLDGRAILSVWRLT